MQQELLCLLCSQQYTSQNPPRTIQCGHSLCQSCIKQALSKKIPKNHTLTCPEDKQTIQLKNTTLSHFPKNLALIKLLTAHHFTKKQAQSLSLQNGSLNESNIVSKVLPADDSEDQEIVNAINETTRETENTGGLNLEDLCLIHEKPLDIVCLQDKTKICSTCAIFGKHKGHEFKKLEEVEKDKISACQQILSVIQKKQSLQTLVNSNESKEKNNAQLRDRKQLLTKQIKERFMRLTEILQLAEKKSIEKLGRIFLQISPQIADEFRFSARRNKEYEEWAELAFKFIESNNLEEQLELLDYGGEGSVNVVDDGVRLLKELEGEFQCISMKMDEIVRESVVVEFKTEVDSKLAGYCSVMTKDEKQKEKEKELGSGQLKTTQHREKQESGKQKSFDKEIDRMKNSIIIKQSQPSRQKQESKRSLNSSRARLQEIKISRIDPTLQSQLPFLSPQSSTSYQKQDSIRELQHQKPRKISDNDDLLIDQHKSEEKKETLFDTNIEIPSIANLTPFQFQFSSHTIDSGEKLTNRKIEFSPIPIQTDNQSMNGSMIKSIGPKKIVSLKGNILPTPATKRKSKLKLPEKYQKVYDAILNDTLDVADFTNGELGDTIISQILENIKGKKIKTLKLIRNKLTDEGMDKLWGCLENIITLNLSQNLLTDRFVEQLYQNLGRLPNLRSVILSQNKIRERNVKNKIEEIKKHEITVSI